MILLIPKMLLLILLNLSFTIISPLWAADYEDVYDKNELNCNSEACSYLLNVEEPGFFVMTVQNPENKSSGFWGLSAETHTSTISETLHLGSILKENGEAPVFFSVYLNSADTITLIPYEYTNQLSQVKMRILDSARTTVYETEALVGERVVVPALESRGFHTVEVSTLPGEPKGRFGLSVELNGSPDGFSFGGWIDALEGDSPEGFAAFYLTQGELLLRLMFGEAYGEFGADKPDVKIYRLNEAGELELFWQPPFITRISQNKMGKDTFMQKISANGRFLAYVANDSDIAADQVFLYDCQTAESTRVSDIENGNFTPGEINGIDISSDGNYVAYKVSEWSPGPMGGFISSKVLIYETETEKTVQVAANTSSATLPSPQQISISGDGHYIVYSIDGDLTLYDRLSEQSQTLDVVAYTTKNFEISSNGDYLVFSSLQNDLVADDLNPGSDIFIKTLSTGKITLISRLEDNYEFQGQNLNPSVSADGRYVVFIADTGYKQEVYLYDAQLATAKKVSDIGGISQPVISDDGRYIVFESSLTLDHETTENENNIFVLKKMGSENQNYQIYSLIPGANNDSHAPIISGDGHFIAFCSYADNLIAGDVNQEPDLFMFLAHDKVMPVNMGLSKNYKLIF